MVGREGAYLRAGMREDEMASISGSVGEGGVNREADVEVIQQMLIDAGQNPGIVDGDYGGNTRDAILAFQRTFSANPDGRIDPGGQTLRRLTEASGKPAAAPSAGPAAAPSQFTDWSGDSSQWPQDKKLASLDASFRPKVERIIDRLAKAGYQPKIVFGWRSTEVQRRLVREGKSKVSFSFHNAQTPKGIPNAWAVDLVDKRWAWNEPDCMKFFNALGAEAKVEGLVWGGDWTGFRDWAHIQGRQNSELAKVKAESGL